MESAKYKHEQKLLLNETRVPPRHIHNISQPSRNLESLFLEPVSESEIFSVIQELKNKAGGNDDLSAHTLKLAAPYITPVFTRIIYKCLMQCICPRQFKMAQVCQV